MRVYVAGPYTKGDVAVNVKNAMDAATDIINQQSWRFTER